MKIAITIGDAAGVGPEVILKTLGGSLPADITPVVYGSRQALVRENAWLGEAAWEDEELESRLVGVGHVDEVDEAGGDREARPEGAPVGVVDVLPEVDFSEVEKGQQDPRCARLQYEAFSRAVEDAREDKVAAVVTAPWNKGLFRTIDEPASGHTDILTDTFQTTSPVMMLAGPRLRVALVTTHIPLKRVADRLTGGKLRSVIRTTVGGLRRRFGIDHPKVAVCGLNPHAGEDGAMGDEEAQVIEPTLEQLSQELEGSVTLQGPMPSDTLFAKFSSGAPYDAVIAMYHDQGLIPLKLLHFGESANITLGLPIIRTSVDHGTAYDIAGQGVAEPGSLRYAIELAAQMARANG